MRNTKMLTVIAFLIIAISSIKLKAQNQEKDYSLARVGEKIHGVYIFVRSQPYQEYDYIATITVKINWSGSTYESFEKAIDKAKKKYPYFNGMVFQRKDLTKVDLIKFKGLGVSRGGFKIGDKVSFISGFADTKSQEIGEVIELESSKDKASIKYVDIYGEEKIAKVSYGKITPIDTDVYMEKLTERLVEIKKYKFKIGDKVSWVYAGKQYKGEVIGLDDRYHKAEIKLIEGEEEKVKRVGYLELTKIE
jgi:hypothetical protein